MKNLKYMITKIRHYIRLVFFSFIVLLVISCGDIFSYKEKIVDRYYAMETDTKEDIAIYYKTSSGEYIGRIPATVLKYGFNDSLIIAQCRQMRTIKYYILDRKKDSDYAEPKNVLIGPLTEEEFNDRWQQKLKIRFIDIQ